LVLERKSLSKNIQEKIAALERELQELKNETEEGFASVVIKAKPFVVAEKASTTITTRVRVFPLPNMKEYGLPYSKVADKKTDLSQTTELESCIVVSADKDYFVWEIQLIPTVDDTTRIFRIETSECTITNPLKNKWKDITLTVKKDSVEESLLVFYKHNMAHVLAFQALMDFLNGKPDQHDVLHVVCDASGPSQFTILRLVEPVRFV
jgi:hypothetical protein